MAPVSAGTEVPRITPVPDGYACGDRIFNPEAPRLFSNGRVTITQEIEGGRAVRFGMGRAAFLECKRLP